MARTSWVWWRRRRRCLTKDNYRNLLKHGTKPGESTARFTHPPKRLKRTAFEVTFFSSVHRWPLVWSTPLSLQISIGLIEREWRGGEWKRFLSLSIQNLSLRAVFFCCALFFFPSLALSILSVSGAECALWQYFQSLFWCYTGSSLTLVLIKLNRQKTRNIFFHLTPGDVFFSADVNNWRSNIKYLNSFLSFLFPHGPLTNF